MSLISFTLGIPNGPDNPSNDQPDMKINNDNIPKYVAVDHIPFNVNSSGLHSQCTIQEQGSAGSVPSTNQLGFETLYAQVTSSLAVSGELFFSRGGVSTGIQLTGPGVPAPSLGASMTSQTGPGTVIGTSMTFIPGGMKVFFGKVNSANDTSTGQTITFPSGGFPNNVFFALATPTSSSTTQNASVTIKSGSLTKTGVIFYCPTADINSLYWLAVGN
jgi:hypothetical protein